MAFEDEFLIDRDPRRWLAQDGSPPGLVTTAVFLGAGDHALEVALAVAPQRPKVDDVRKLWHARQGKRPSPLLLIVAYPDQGSTRVTVCGPVGEQPPVVGGLEASQVERLADAALSEPSRHAAIRFLVAMLPDVGADLPGLRNSGLLASQELSKGVPLRTDWAESCRRSATMLPLKGRQLVEKLGFTVEQLSVSSSILTVPDGPRRAVAVFLDEGETFDDPLTRLGSTPVSHALALADRENVPWVVLTRGRQIRLYAAKADTGVGRKGRSETFVEVNLALLPEQQAGYLSLLFSSEALADGGTLDEVLAKSADFAADLAVRLRERVYFEAVPGLAAAVASRIDSSQDLTEKHLADAYEQTLTILFRLLFLAYAEDKDLLPYRTNSRYADHSLKRIARRLAEDQQSNRVVHDSVAIDHWDDIVQLWRAVDKGNAGWGVPGYNGGLFSNDPEVNAAGAALAQIQLTDAEFGPALMAILVDEGADGVIGPVDFRSLSVREFGTIYEGLLESQLSVAPSDLAVDAKGNYVPVTAKTPSVVDAGEIYFHNRSGARKASGSYFTKPFAVEHLLDHALEPSLDDHVGRLKALVDEGDEAAAADAFFDFRCVDLAMGSGHFLVAAVDRIEARLSGFLALHPIPTVAAELEQLRQAALLALGDLADGTEIETSSLLRRQVARRCVYGVDMNHVSVELARLAIWIHTFVPGLPLSFLDHSLVHGNSLTGIGTLDEALSILDPKAAETGATSLFRGQIEEFLERASDALRRLARTTEATVADVRAARVANAEARAAVQPARDLFDLLVAARLGEVPRIENIEETAIRSAVGAVIADGIAEELNTLHFPVAFPEVFLRDRPGFDCILGNPPWEEATVEELGFWALRYPGLKGMRGFEQDQELQQLRRTRPDQLVEYEREVRETSQLRTALINGPFPGMGQGDPDLYKAFTWRFWDLVRQGGAFGVVLPRSALSAAGSSSWRTAVLDGGSFDDVTMTLNSAGWVFDDADTRKTIGLISVRKGIDFVGRIKMRGPFASFREFRSGMAQPSVEFEASAFRTWSDGASFPVFPTAKSIEVFLRLRAHPRLDARAANSSEWRARPATEIHATNDRSLFDRGQDDRMPVAPDNNELTPSRVPVFKGASFNIWQPDTGVRYGWSDRSTLAEGLQTRRLRQQRIKRSPMSELSGDWARNDATAPWLHPRIAFRDITNRTNTRTVIAALLPGNVALTNKAPYLLWPAGDERDQAFLLAVLSSLPLDWYARRVVDGQLNFHIFNGLPIPATPRTSELRRRSEVIAGRLAAVDERYQAWADVVGVECGSVRVHE